MGYRSWSKAELEMLRSQYPSQGSNIPELLSRHTDAAIRAKARMLGIKTENYKLWSEEEDTILKQNYALGLSRCASLLPGRETSAIYQRAGKLGLKISGEAKAVDISVRSETSMTGKSWSETEIDTLKRLWDNVPMSQVIEALPDRQWKNIVKQAKKLGLVPNDTKYWTEEELNILRENYHKGISYVLPLLPGRTYISVQGKATRLGLTSTHRARGIPWSEAEYTIIRDYYQKDRERCFELLPNRSREAIRVRAGMLGCATKYSRQNAIYDISDDIVVNGKEFKSLAKVLKTYGLSRARVYRLMSEHGASLNETLEKCIAGEWDAKVTCKWVVRGGDFGIAGDVKVVYPLSTFNGMALCACERCMRVHLLSLTKIDGFICDKESHDTIYPKSCYVPYTFKCAARRRGITIENPAMRDDVF